MSSVRDFGAVGDGITDDTEALQHALNDGDGQIVFPRGDYRITQTLTIDLTQRSRTSITGNGGVAKILMAGPGPAISLLASHAKSADPLGFRPEEWQRERMPTIDGIEIEGAHPQADGIRIQGVMQATLTRVLIREVNTAVHLTDRARNVIIDTCQIYHNRGIGVHFDAVNLHQCIISDSHISYCRLGGIRIEDSEVRNLQITGNDIEYNNVRSHVAAFPTEEDAATPTAEIYIDVVNGSVREGTISSNTIQATYSPGGANIRFIGSSPEVNHKTGMFTISGNLIGSQNINIHLSSAWGVNVSGNYLYSGHHRNIVIEDSRNIVLCGNIFGHNPDYNDKELATGIRIENSINCNLTGLQIQDAQAGKHTVENTVPLNREALVEIIHCQRMNITGCQILDGTPIGMLLEGCTDTLIGNCTIIDQRETPLMEHGLVWKGSGKGNLLSNSRIAGAADAGTHIDPASGVTVQGNLID